MPGLKIMLVAGEPSGDALGAHLMRAARAMAGEEVEFIGVGGDQMEAEGLRSLFPMSILSVMGLFEIAPGLSQFFDVWLRLRPLPVQRHRI